MMKAPKSPLCVSPDGRFQKSSDYLFSHSDLIIYPAYDKETGLEVTWHEFFTANFPQGCLEKMIQIIEAIKSEKFPNLLQFIYYWTDESQMRLHVITESRCSNSIGERINQGFLNAKPLAIAKWFYPVLETLDSLHTHNPPIVHRNISLQSIFVKASSGNIKISPPRLINQGKSWDPNSLLLRVTTPPEALTGVTDTSSDIWNVGIAMLTAISETPPYSECNTPAKLIEALSTYTPPKILQPVSCPELKDIITQCLQEPHLRPTARELMCHPFFGMSYESSSPTPSSNDSIEVLFVNKKDSSVKSKGSSTHLPTVPSDLQIALNQSPQFSSSMPYMNSSPPKNSPSQLTGIAEGS